MSVIVTSVRDDAGVASHSQNVLPSSTGVNRTAEASENDSTSEGEAAVNRDRQYQATFREADSATAAQRWLLTTTEAAATLSLINTNIATCRALDIPMSL